MKLVFQILLALICFVYLLKVASTANKSEEENLNPQWSYCFEFTWMGPDYDNSTQYNGTCADYLEESGAKGIPCNPPIVITYNGTFPDIDYLWKYHRSSIVCRRSSGQVCARYAYYYNGAMTNATYMCTKVQVVGEESVRKGCFTQKVSDYEVEICACVSGRGTYKPCNIHF
ncbi:uncharacterized protein LOC123309162 [Coccinella septempunctata]|uniref:uncharacterized protein LOC123309162 n=1 Tax=Coccinella septempunctata TaxID=41139 RepID=UPI001D0877A1|nr:uncharacterized protein LOC123309162 [Coccinella septempunctata]